MVVDFYEREQFYVVSPCGMRIDECTFIRLDCGRALVRLTLGEIRSVSIADLFKHRSDAYQALTGG